LINSLFIFIQSSILRNSLFMLLFNVSRHLLDMVRIESSAKSLVFILEARGKSLT